MRLRAIVGVLILFAILAVATPVLAAPPDPATLQQMTVPQLRQYAEEHRVNLGDATSKEVIISLIIEGMAKQESDNGFKPPPRDWFKPVVPDLSDDTVLGRAANVGRLGLGLFGCYLIGYALWRALSLAHRALSGALAIKQIALEGAVILGGFAVVLALLGGYIYTVLEAIFRFAVTAV